jgi:hypothetical protein
MRWGAVRAFCERIGGGDRRPIKGARRMASWRRNGRGRGGSIAPRGGEGGALGPDRRAAAGGSAPKPAGTGGVWTREAVRGPLTHGPLLQCHILNPSTGLNHSTEFEFKF